MSDVDAGILLPTNRILGQRGQRPLRYSLGFMKARKVPVKRSTQYGPPDLRWPAASIQEKRIPHPKKTLSN
jgi:hypothetical protein